jgi:DNA repair protein SbcC/Rad50
VFQEINIKNFQSHKETKIQFENGVNVLVGSSDQGKSAILRAMLWAINNRPLGTDDIVSHWARDNKNKIADTMSVKIKTENGIVTRKRTAESNEYILKDNANNQKTFEAVNKDVPKDISDFFKLTDVNIQQQHDAPFLLSASASDVAKYFNKIVRLDVIDTVLGNVESERRDINKKIKETENEKKSFEKQLEDFDWIEKAVLLADKIKIIDDRINELDDGWQVIDAEVKDYLIQKNFLKDFPDIKTAKLFIEKIESINIDYDLLSELEKSIEKYREANRDRKIYEMVKGGNALIEKIDLFDSAIKVANGELVVLQDEINLYFENKKISEMGFDKKHALNLIKEIESIQPDYILLRELNTQVNEYIQNKEIIKKSDIDIEQLKKQLPDECPICGKSMKECIDE